MDRDFTLGDFEFIPLASQMKYCVSDNTRQYEPVKLWCDEFFLSVLVLPEEEYV